MDAFLAVASRREVREYAARPIPVDAVQRILEAGRVAGSARNRQPWRFVILEDPTVRDRFAEFVSVPTNVRTAALVVVITVRGRGPTMFDAGRAAQNMMLTAWNDRIGSCPNSMADQDAVARLLELDEEERPAMALTFGYPVHERDPDSREAVDWLARADRKPLDELVARR